MAHPASTEAATESIPDELPPGPFVKIYGSILDSSIWRESSATRLVWITMLAIADANGYVRASVGGLAHRANVSVAECRAALEVLQSPDEDDRSGVEEGRRIKPLQGGWFVINFRNYRDLRTEKQIKTAERVRKYRQRTTKPDSPDGASQHDTSNAPGVTSVTGVTVTPEGEGEGEEEMLAATDRPQPIAEPATSPQSYPQPTPPLAELAASNYALACTVALNQGMLDNPAVGESANPALPFTASALGAAEDLLRAGVDVETAKATIYAAAKGWTPSRLGKGISSIAYFAGRIMEEHQRTSARTAAASAPRPATATNGTAAPSGVGPAANGSTGQRHGSGRRDLKGEGLILFGRIRDAVGDVTVLSNPELGISGGNRRERRIPDAMLEALNPSARTALEAIGGARRVCYPGEKEDALEQLGWKFAAAYAAAEGGQ